MSPVIIAILAVILLLVLLGPGTIIHIALFLTYGLPMLIAVGIAVWVFASAIRGRS